MSCVDGRANRGWIASAAGVLGQDPFKAASAERLTRAAVVPSGFEETVAFSGLTNPTAVRFAPDGRIFVAEKSGLIKYFDAYRRALRGG